MLAANGRGMRQVRVQSRQTELQGPGEHHTFCQPLGGRPLAADVCPRRLLGNGCNAGRESAGVGGQ